MKYNKTKAIVKYRQREKIPINFRVNAKINLLLTLFSRY